MDEQPEDLSAQGEEQPADTLAGRRVSRREFLRMAGAAGAAVGLAGGLGGLMAACGDKVETTTTTAGATTTTSAAGSTTTVSAGVEAGREIKVGYVSASTGRLSAMGVVDKYLVKRWEDAVANGLVCGDGKNHPIKFSLEDSQSSSDRAAKVSSDLILNGKVDVLMAGCGVDTANPAADQAEANGIPGYFDDTIVEAFISRAADPEVGFKFTYSHFFGVDDLFRVYYYMWEDWQTNKLIGTAFPNDGDGVAFGDHTNGMPGYIEKQGYKYIDPGRFEVGTDDYTSHITEFKKAGCEILAGIADAGDFVNLWTQCMQQGFRPKVVTFAKAIDLPQAVEACGNAANNFGLECMWHPRWPFVSSLTGETCQQLADGWEQETGKQWASYLMRYELFEVVADALKRSPNIDDKQAVADAIGQTNIVTMLGPVNFSAPVQRDGMHPYRNICRSPLMSSQWVKSAAGSKFPYEMMIVNNKNYPDIPAEAKMLPMVYE